MLKFDPTAPTPPTVNMQVRIGVKDKATLERRAKRLGCHTSELIRQAVKFAVEHMENDT